MKKLSVVLSCLLLTGLAYGQDATETEEGAEGVGTSSFVDEGYNELSLYPIHRSDIMWQKTLLRAVDLREKQNEPLFSKNKELSQIIIDAAKANEMKLYASDSLDAGRELKLSEFLEKLKIPSDEVEISEEDAAFMIEEEPSDDGWGFEEETVEEEVVEAGPEYFTGRDLYQLEFKEDMIFDKQRSRMYYDILAVTLKLPADHPLNLKGIEETIASFSYKELCKKVFHNNPNAIWFNPLNDAEHRTLEEALELRLFSSYILKVSNPRDDYLVDIYGGDPWTGIMASQWKTYELLEFEHNLWEF